MREALRIGAAMRFHHHAAQAEHHGAVVAARVQPLAQPLQPRAGQQVADARGQRGGEHLAQHLAHQLQRALAGLERHVAGETVGHDHVGGAGGDVVAFHEAVELAAQVADLQHLGRLADALVALQLLGADIEQADGGGGEAEHGAGEHVAHHGELHQVAHVAQHVGAEVEHHHVAARRGADGGHGRAVDAGQRLDDDLGQRQQRAGIAGRDHASRLAARHRVDRQAHGGSAQAQRGGGLEVAGDHLGGMTDGAGARRPLVAGQQRQQARLVAHQQEAGTGVPLRRDGQAGDNDVGGAVAPHRVDCQG